MTAKEAKELTDKLRPELIEQDTEYLLTIIKEHVEEGEYFLSDGDCRKEAYENIRELGYKVDYHPESNSYFISWE